MDFKRNERFQLLQIIHLCVFLDNTQTKHLLTERHAECWKEAHEHESRLKYKQLHPGTN